MAVLMTVAAVLAVIAWYASAVGEVRWAIPSAGSQTQDGTQVVPAMFQAATSAKGTFKLQSQPLGAPATSFVDAVGPSPVTTTLGVADLDKNFRAVLGGFDAGTLVNHVVRVKSDDLELGVATLAQDVGCHSR